MLYHRMSKIWMSHLTRAGLGYIASPPFWWGPLNTLARPRFSQSTQVIGNQIMPENDFWKIPLFIFLPHLCVGANVRDPSRKPIKQWWGTLHSSAWQSAPWPLAGLGKCGRWTCKKTRGPFKLNKNKNKEQLKLIISGHSHLERTTHCHCCLLLSWISPQLPYCPHSINKNFHLKFSVYTLHP